MIEETRNAVDLFMKLYALPTVGLTGLGILAMYSYRIREKINQFRENRQTNPTEKIILIGNEYMFNLETAPTNHREKIRYKNLQRVLTN